MRRGINSLSLTEARLDIPCGSFGFIGSNWCDHCKGIDAELEYHMTHRQTLEQPEEGVETCPKCGSEDCGENQEDHHMTVVRRYSIHRNPHYRGAA